MMQSNTTLDDISGEIGFTATTTLATWYGGKNLYVPAHPTADSMLVRIVGMEAATRLAECWGGEMLALPTMRAYEYEQCRFLIALMLQGGIPLAQVARRVGMSERRIEQVRHELRAAGLLPCVGAGSHSLAQQYAKDIESIAAMTRAAHGPTTLADYWSSAAEMTLRSEIEMLTKAANDPAMEATKRLIETFSVSTYAQESALKEEAKSRELWEKAYGPNSFSSNAQDMALREEARSRELWETLCGAKTAQHLLSDEIAKMTSSNSLASYTGSLAGAMKMFDAAEGADRDADAMADLARALPVTVLAPETYSPPIRVELGPSLADVMEENNRQQDKRHREQLSEVKRIAENNDRRSEEIDKRERAFNQQMLRVTIILGLGAAAVGAWIYLVPYIFG